MTVEVNVNGKEITGWRKYVYGAAALVGASGVIAGVAVMLVIIAAVLLSPIWVPALIAVLLAR